MKKNRVILLGIDGATWDLINKFIEQGKLPAFARLKKEGSWGVLKSTAPCYSPLAWNSIFSGVEPAKHGIVGFVEHLYASLNLRPLSSVDRIYPALWNYTDYYSLESTFINIPFSFPLDIDQGIFISGLGVPSQKHDYTYPLDLKNQINRNYPDYRIDFDERLVLKKDSESFKKECFKILDSRLRLAKDLFTKENWQVFSLVIRLTDILQHFCWDDTEAIEESYLKIDSFLNFIINNIKPTDNLVMVSDHGFSKLKSMVHIVNFFLDKGYMISKKKAQTGKGLNVAKLKECILGFGGESLLNFLKRNEFLKNLLFKALPIGKYSYLRSIDWENSLLSYAEGSGGIIHLNPKVKKDAKKVEEVFFRLKKDLLELKDDNGEQVFEDVCQFPNLDITLRVRKGYCVDGYDSQDKSIFGKSKSGYIGMHDEDGLIAIYGSGVKKYLNIKPAKVYDILPTILALLTKEVPAYLDGRVLDEVFIKPLEYRETNSTKDSFLSKRPPRKDYSQAEQQAVEEKLKNLGYL
jgi:predicted AlkP superfamily phosphohydrolase/phosphomutase